MKKRKKRPYRYRTDTLTLAKLIELIDSGQEVIDLKQYRNGESWFRSLSHVFPVTGLRHRSTDLVCSGETPMNNAQL